jgi:CubicO group peptidase (beta-lactamase class C family)
MTMQRSRSRIRTARRGLETAAVLAVLALGMTAVPAGATTTSADTPQEETASAIADVMQSAMAEGHLRAVIVEVTQGGEVVTRQAFGTSMDGVPATTDMHFRNGAVAFAYLGTLLMQFVDEHEVGLDDTIDRWMPDLPEADEVTLRMLANQTSGYPDYESDPAWEAAWNADPFHVWTFEERLAYAFSRPVVFPPGTNWSYAHTNFMILGEILAEIGGKPLDQLLREKVLGPMGLTDTVASVTSGIPDPVLHTFSSERRGALGIPPTTAFYEESTFWNTQWGTPIGANQTTTIDDMTRTAEQVGTGALLSESSYHEMTDSNLLGFGHPDPACAPSCFTQVEGYNYGLGIVRSGSWMLQNPLLAGFSGTAAYLPSQEVAVAVAVTYQPGAFDAEGNYANAADRLFRLIGAVVAPDDAPPMPPG